MCVEISKYKDKSHVKKSDSLKTKIDLIKTNLDIDSYDNNPNVISNSKLRTLTVYLHNKDSEINDILKDTISDDLN